MTVTRTHQTAPAKQVDAEAAARIESVAFVLADVTRLMRKGFDRRVRALKLTRSHWRVLVYVLQNEGLSQSTLAKRLEIERAPLGQLVRALEGMGLVQRERSTTDQREWIVRAGEQAYRVLPQLTDAAAWLRSVSLQGITREEQILLRRLLERMRSNLSFELERGPIPPSQ